MSDAPFHRTYMGQRFYEATMPGLVRQLARLNDNLERLIAVADGGKAKPDEDGVDDNRAAGDGT